MPGRIAELLLGIGELLGMILDFFAWLGKKLRGTTGGT